MDILECSTRTLYGKMMATLAVKFEFTPRMLGAETTRFMKHQFDSIEGNPTRIIYGHSMGLSFLLSFILSFYLSFFLSFLLMHLLRIELNQVGRANRWICLEFWRLALPWQPSAGPKWLVITFYFISYLNE